MIIDVVEVVRPSMDGSRLGSVMNNTCSAEDSRVLVPENFCFSAQSEGRMAATVWNWSSKTLSPGVLLAVLYFSSCHIFLPV